MNSDAIRQAFLDFFRERDHMKLPSAPLVPNSSYVTTLFTIAGMQQVIPYFLGLEQPPSRRLVSVQKAVRTNDIDEVGDWSHHTYLEMLGNFSVGDYFKREAIGYTWEFLTQVMGIPPERWWAVTYPGDTEARDAWLAVGIPAERIGETEENWWQPGPTGPQGPNSEIHFDRGPEYGCGGANCRPEAECCDRFLEVWNDVFIEFTRDEPGGELKELPWKNVDTGMGFERLVSVMQGKDSAYETDLFQPIIRSVTRLGTPEYGSDARSDRSLRIIADHSRAITFVAAEGVMPSAEGRGYVLRRLIRRAALHGRLLGLDRPFLSEPVGSVIERMSGYWTELEQRRLRVLEVVQEEERRFLQTLQRGLGIFEDMVERALQDASVISGEEAFVLYDTHGFPFELTVELAQERGLSVDREGFELALRRQQERARADVRGKSGSALGTLPDTYVELAGRLGKSVFTGYDELVTTTEVVAVVADGQPVNRAEAGEEVDLFLAATPFYAEAGGQVGDTGVIRGDNADARVLDTQRPHPDLIAHRARIERGTLTVGDVVRAEVDTERRLHILPHHSGTHLLHKALQEVLGPEATQAGSLVAPDRLRFDFRWPRPVTSDELREIQDRVNAAIWANLPVRKEWKPYDQAIQEGAMALFGEKYGDLVRVVSMGDWSKELCGGTHVNATGDIGLLVITSETGIGSGIRRVEALAGAAAYAHVNRLREQLSAVAEVLETKPDTLLARAEHVMTMVREGEKRIAALVRRMAAREAETLLDSATEVNGVTVVASQVQADDVDYLQAVADAVKSRLERGAVVIAAVVGGRPVYIMTITRGLKEAGLDSGAILRGATRGANGGAGGSAEFAQGGGGDPARVNDVLSAAVDSIRQRLEN